MKELNQLENRLRSWTPRLPSASIKRRLFPHAARSEQACWLVDEAVDHNPFHWRWLAPAMALCAGALILLARSAGSGDSASERLMPTFALSNLDFATYYAAAAQNDRNALPMTTFEWTNGAHSPTTHHSFFDRTGYRE